MILDDAEKKAESLIQQGQNVANGLISHAGIELDATVQSANQGLGANINKTVEQLANGEQRFAFIQEWIKTSLIAVGSCV